MPALVPVPCALCEADDAETVFAAGVAQFHRIVRCRHCGHLYANPRSAVPEHALLAARDPDEAQWRTGSTLRRQKEERQVRDYTRLRERLGATYPRKRRLLEVGSGFGCLLHAFQSEGWEVVGLEPFEGYCRHARAAYGVDARATTLEQADLPAEEFDVALLLHVIEHLPDPRRTLAGLHRVLVPGGTLVIETPRYDSLAFRLLGRRERSISCDAHIHFFTDATLRATVEAASFEFVAREWVGRSLSMLRLLWNIGVITKLPPVRRCLVAFGLWAGLDRRFLRVNVADMVRMTCRKPLADEASAEGHSPREE